MGACAAVPDAGFVLVARAPAGCPVRNNPYATAANSASSTIAAIFCVVFMVCSYLHPILYAGTESGPQFLHFQNLECVVRRGVDMDSDCQSNCSAPLTDEHLELLAMVRSLEL